jgi:hypothetical protein
MRANATLGARDVRAKQQGNGRDPPNGARPPEKRKVLRRLVRDRRHHPFVTAGIVAFHLGFAVAGLIWSDSLQQAFDKINLDAETFFARLLVSGIILFPLAWALKASGIWRRRRGSPVLLASALSVVIATLLAAEAWRGAGSPITGSRGTVTEWSTVAYLLFTEHRAMALTALFTVIASLLAAYYIVRGLLTVRYEGTGLQIRLPGQTLYHVPIFPQDSWQNTEIHLHEGDEVSIEISGRVSPGALQGLVKLDAQRKRFQEVMKGTITRPEYYAELATIVWPYTGPEGYSAEWYHEPKKQSVLRDDPLYQEDDFYRKDPCLTVRGLTHNTVVGMIRAANESEPRKATLGQPGYDYSDPNDQEQLICLSSKRYPIKFEAPRTGELWVVINDVDEVRWDNTGLFFLKVVQHQI